MLFRPASACNRKRGSTSCSSSMSNACSRNCRRNVSEARCGREERIGRRGGRERQHEIPGPDLGPDRRRVGPDGHARGTDAVGTVSVAYPDTVQRQRSGIGPLLRGRGAEVEAEGPADPVRRHAQRRQIELRDTPRQPHRLPLAGHLPERSSARRSASSRSAIRPERRPSSSTASIPMPPKSRPAYSRRSAPTLTETVVCGAKGSKPVPRASAAKSTVPSESAGRNAPEREAVAPHPRFVGLSRRIEPSRGREAAAADLKRRIRRHRTAVQLPAAPRRVIRAGIATRRRNAVSGSNASRNSSSRKSPLETDRNGRCPPFRQVLRPAFRPQAAMPGHGELQPDPAQVGQCPGGRQRQAHFAVAQRLRNREQQPHVPCREIGAERSPDLRCGSQSERPGPACTSASIRDEAVARRKPLQRHGPAVLHEPSRGRTHGQPAALGEVQPFDPQGDVASPVIHRIEREIERRERDRLRIESAAGACPIVP